MSLRYLPCDRNACGYPRDHPPDKCFELPVSSSRERPGAAFSNTLASQSQASSSATQVKPCPSYLQAPFCRDTGWRSKQEGRAPCTKTGANSVEALSRGRTLRAAVPGTMPRYRARQLYSRWWQPMGWAPKSLQVFSHLLLRVQQHFVIKPLPVGNFPHSRVCSGSRYHT